MFVCCMFLKASTISHIDFFVCLFVWFLWLNTWRQCSVLFCSTKMGGFFRLWTSSVFLWTSASIEHFGLYGTGNFLLLFNWKIRKTRFMLWTALPHWTQWQVYKRFQRFHWLRKQFFFNCLYMPPWFPSKISKLLKLILLKAFPLHRVTSSGCQLSVLPHYKEEQIFPLGSCF